MRNLLSLLIMLITLSGCVSNKDFTQTCNFYKQEINNNTEKIKALEERITKIEALRSSSTTTRSAADSESSKSEKTVTQKCKGTTASGNQCSRNAKEGSDYCWQHEKSKTKTQSTTESKTKSSSSPKIHTGPRGGKYYINSSGKKVYLKK